MTLETLHTAENLTTGKIVLLSSLDPRMADENRFRVISPVTRDLDYAGFVYKDKWGGVWRMDNALEDISNAMEKWA